MKFIFLFMMIAIPVRAEVDEGRWLAAVRAVEGWDGHAIGARGERGPYQIMPATWAQYSLHAVSWAALDSAAANRERERVARAHLRWLRKQLKRIGREDTAYNLAIAWNAGFERSRMGAPKRAHAYARRVANFYEEFTTKAQRAQSPE